MMGIYQTPRCKSKSSRPHRTAQLELARKDFSALEALEVAQ